MFKKAAKDAKYILEYAKLLIIILGIIFLTVLKLLCIFNKEENVGQLNIQNFIYSPTFTQAGHFLFSPRHYHPKQIITYSYTPNPKYYFVVVYFFKSMWIINDIFI